MIVLGCHAFTKMCRLTAAVKTRKSDDRPGRQPAGPIGPIPEAVQLLDDHRPPGLGSA